LIYSMHKWTKSLPYNVRFHKRKKHGNGDKVLPYQRGKVESYESAHKRFVTLAIVLDEPPALVARVRISFKINGWSALPFEISLARDDDRIAINGQSVERSALVPDEEAFGLAMKHAVQSRSTSNS